MPQTGNSCYFIHKGVKYIEAVYNPTGSLLKAGVRPQNPPLFKKPAKPYYFLSGVSNLYDFEKQHPGKRLWINWRLRYLDKLPKAYIKLLDSSEDG